MRIKYIIFYFLLFSLYASSQADKNAAFVRDTMSMPETGKTLEGEYVETTLKNLSVLRFFKTDDNKYFLRFIVTKNFYFNKTGVLEIRSGSKSYYAKNAKQYKIDKSAGLFLIEVQRNYIGTIKDHSITSLVFGEAETTFTKQDAAQIKTLALFFYASISEKH